MADFGLYHDGRYRVIAFVRFLVIFYSNAVHEAELSLPDFELSGGFFMKY